MMDPEVLERIAARRAELDGLEEQLVKWRYELSAMSWPWPSGCGSG
ncbi:hypothetical protein [Streptomyces sp. WAC01526]|nr:hypothetical protein [Streptomyces sp. WAC01526]